MRKKYSLKSFTACGSLCSLAPVAPLVRNSRQIFNRFSVLQEAVLTTIELTTELTIELTTELVIIMVAQRANKLFRATFYKMLPVIMKWWRIDATDVPPLPPLEKRQWWDDYALSSFPP